MTAGAACWRENRRDLLAGLRQRHMGYVLQTGGLLPFCTVYENMELSARALGLPGRRENIGVLARALGIERLLPELAGRIQAKAVRVPTVNVSCLDITMQTATATDATEVNRVVRGVFSLGIDLVRWYRPDGADSPAQLGEFYGDLVLRMLAR